MIEEEVQRKFIAGGFTLSVAESCTGGAIAARLTSIPGASRYFLGSIVAYSNIVKEHCLNVSPVTLGAYGAVSSQTVVEMVEGLLDATGSDFGIAVTGIAGPEGGTSEKPVGTVWVAIAKRNEAPVVWCIQANGVRSQIINFTVEAVLTKLVDKIRFEQP